MKELFDRNSVNYILRTYLPTWNYEQRIEEIVRFCKETGTKNVMLFTDAQHMVWNQLTLEEAALEADNIARAIRRFSSENIRCGINSSYNQRQSRWDHREHNNYDFWATYADKSCEYRLPCLLDPKLDVYLKQYFTILADAGPEYIYIDDDHRYMLTGYKNTWGCFCPLHLRGISDATGREWTPETLRPALLNEPAVRAAWIDLLGDRLEEIARTIGNAVYAVNPEIRIGMMIPNAHTLPVMGHDITDMARSFSPDAPPLVRPSVGPYSDRDRRQIIPGLFQMEFIGHLLGDTATYTPEIETTPFTRLSKSMTTVRFDITQGILNRMNNPAISLCGYVGDSPFLEPAFVDLLKNSRPFFEKVRSVAPPRGSRKGIQLLWASNAPKSSPRKVDSLTDFYWPAFVLHDILGNSGFPCTYDESPIRFLAGDTAYALESSRIEELLKKNLVLDIVAAQALAERGFADRIGCRPGSLLKNFGAEECTDAHFSGPYTGNYIPLKRAPLKSVFNLLPSEKAFEISRIVNHDREKIASGVVLFENQHGGKVATLPYIIDPVDSDLRHFVCYHRQFMFCRIFDWMDKAAVPIFPEAPSDFAVQCWDDKSALTVCLTNLSYDPSEEIVLRVNDSSLSPSNAVRIAKNGEVVSLNGEIDVIPSPDGSALWKLKGCFLLFDPLVLIISRH